MFSGSRNPIGAVVIMLDHLVLAAILNFKMAATEKHVCPDLGL